MRPRIRVLPLALALLVLIVLGCQGPPAQETPAGLQPLLRPVAATSIAGIAPTS